MITDPKLNAQLADYLLMRDSLVEATLRLFNAKDKTDRARLQAELNLLAAITEGQSKDFQEELDRYNANLALAASKPPAQGHAAAMEPPAATPARKRATRSAKK